MEVEPHLTGANVPFNHIMGHLIKYIQSKVPVYALEVKYVFSVKTLDGFLYADALFEYHAREKDRRGRRRCPVPFHLKSCFIHSFTHSLTHSFTHSLTHSFLHSFIHSFLHSFIHSFIHMHSSPLDF